MYRWVEHTGELELEILAPTEAGVFADALAALRELMADGPPLGEAVPRQLDLAAGDRAALLAEWLSELAFVAETERLVPEELRSLSLGDGRLRAAVAARRGDPPHLVKAVTLHRLSFEPAEGGWRATVVIDV